MGGKSTCSFRRILAHFLHGNALAICSSILYEFEEATEDSIFNLLCGASLDIEGFENVKQLCCKTHS
ncbi:hypothetical protein SAY86_013021 [Trapa natans]|uniref:GDPGP1-like C-terminal domain-containing protein n=1 Tax=Trapa natans TaxID=22666 RepID=A0AAN7LYW4_TRANT|nr:hypothetical protein SAY86_013021 [Trapa natans]